MISAAWVFLHISISPDVILSNLLQAIDYILELASTCKDMVCQFLRNSLS
jgi:hypothetical protein